MIRTAVLRCARFDEPCILAKPDRTRAMPFLLRAPQPSDYDALVSWVPDVTTAVCWAGTSLGFPFAATDLPARLEVDTRASYFLSDETGEPLGFGQHWIRQEGAVHLGRIIVSPHKRGLGLGTQLVSLLITQAANATQARVVTLRVYRNNPIAHGIYTKVGFKPVEAESDADVLFLERQVP